MEYWLEGVHGKNRPDAVRHKSHGRGGHGTEVVHILEVDARYGEIAAAAACGGHGDDKGGAAKPYAAIGRSWKIRPKSLVGLAVYVPAVSAAPVVRTPILSAASVSRGRPNTTTTAIHVLEYNEFGESVGEARYWLGSTNDMGLGIAETLAYPRHWNNAG